MQKNNYPNWLVPLEIARKLIKIGMTNSEILVCNDKYYGWYKSEQMYYIDKWGNTYTALEVSKDYNLEPTFTWEQVFEWFREKGFKISLEDHQYGTKYTFYNLKINGGRDYKGDYFNYEKAREALVNKLIEVYKKRVEMYIKEDNKMFLKNLVTIEIAEKMKNIGFRDRCFLYFYKRNPDVFYFELDKMENNYKGTHKNMEFVGYNYSLQKVSIFDYETALKWFRDRGLIGTIVCFKDAYLDKILYIFDIKDGNGYLISSNFKVIETYEEAREEVIKTLIEVYENN